MRKRFGWDSESDRFTDIERAREFFELIAPQTKEAQEPKLKTFSDVRKLKLIVGNLAAEEILLDPLKSYADALAEAQQRPKPAQVKEVLADFLESALARVKSITRQELKELTADDKTRIMSLIAELSEINSK